MLLEQFTAAAAGARNFAALDEISRLSWRALAEGVFDDDAAHNVSEAVEARRLVLKGQGDRKALSFSKPATARHLCFGSRGSQARPVSPDKAASLARRRRWAASGALPPQIAAEFTQAEVAALAVIARECQRRGRCELPIDAVAALAGVSRTTVQNALRHARRIGVLAVQERRRRGQKSLTNVVAITASEWQAWLRIGGGFKKFSTTNTDLYGSAETPVESGDRAGRSRYVLAYSGASNARANRCKNFSQSMSAG